jgi:hypothetical protein
MKNKIILTLFIITLLTLITSVFALDIGYVVKNPSNLDANEETIKTFLESNSHLVTPQNDEAFDASIYDLIIVSEKINRIENIFDNKNHKTLFLSSGAAEESGLGNGITSTRKNIRIIDNNHPITSNYNLEDLEVYSGSNNMGYLKPCWPIDAVSLAQKETGDTESALLAVDKNSLLINSNCANRDILLNERNLFFGLFKATEWNSNAETLFINSINWLTDSTPNNPPTTQTIPDLTWSKGTSKTINLDNYFTDPDGDDLTYTIHETSDQTDITATITNNIVTFTTTPDFTGSDWIIFKAEDTSGASITSNKITLTVTDQPTDQVQITSYTPTTNNLNLLKNTNKIFSITISDTTKTIKWFLNDILQLTTSSTYNFNKDIGDYTLKAVVGDPELTSQTWTINSKSIQDLTCSEANGFICSETQSCSQDFLNTNNPQCCPTTCTANPLEFNDIDREEITTDLGLEIKDPDENEELFIGETTRIKLDIDNNVEDKLDIEIKVYLYDLTEDESIEEYEFTTEINEESGRIVSFDLELPYDINEDNEYAFFVQINDEDEEYFNEDYIEINLERKTTDIIIKKIETLEQSYCGDYFNLDVTLTNMGSNEQDVYITVQNSELNINEKTDVFELEAYDEKDTSINNFNLKIPSETTKGVYPLKIVAHFNNKRITQEKQIAIDCTEINTLNISEVGLNTNKSSASISNKAPKGLIIFNLALTTILTLGLIGSLVYVRKNKIK